MIELPEGISPCPHCTYDTIEHGPKLQVTHGCVECNYTGRKNVWKLVGEKRGGHYHFRLWIGEYRKDGRLICNGIMDEENWLDINQQMQGNPLWKITEL